MEISGGRAKLDECLMFGKWGIEGAQIEQVQKMDRRQFSYAAGELDAGYYVNFIFHAEPDLISKLQSKFKLDPEVYRQHYQKLREKKESKKKVAAEE